MRVLLDENVPHDFRHRLTGHEVFTVAFMGWQGVGNGELLARAAADGFDAVVTKDAGVQFEQNLSSLPVSVIVLTAPTNTMDDLLPLVPALLRTLEGLPPRTLVRVD